MKLRFQVGWVERWDERGEPLDVREFDSLRDVARAFPEVFGGLIPMTLRAAYRVVDFVNSEGNYHDFLFRVVEIPVELYED